VMRRHRSHAGACETSAGALANLCATDGQAQLLAGHSGGEAALLDCLEVHAGSPLVAEQALLALANLCAEASNCEEAVTAGACSQLAGMLRRWRSVSPKLAPQAQFPPRWPCCSLRQSRSPPSRPRRRAACAR